MKKTNKGFSLVELIIVIAIMAILIGVLAPQYIKYVEKSRVSADEDNAEQMLTAVTTACTDEDYIDSINNGDTLTWPKSGAASSTSTGITTAMGEYFAAWNTVSVKSKSYKNVSNGYTVYVSADAKSSLKCSGSWN